MFRVYPEPSQMNYTVNVTDTASFECIVTGIPAPTILWFRNGTELSDTNPRVTTSVPVVSTVPNNAGEIVLQVIRILNLGMSQDNDSGLYECRVSNAATPGEDTGMFELVVQSKSSITCICFTSCTFWCM